MDFLKSFKNCLKGTEEKIKQVESDWKYTPKQMLEYNALIFLIKDQVETVEISDELKKDAQHNQDEVNKLIYESQIYAAKKIGIEIPFHEKPRLPREFYLQIISLSPETEKQFYGHERKYIKKEKEKFLSLLHNKKSIEETVIKLLSN